MDEIKAVVGRSTRWLLDQQDGTTGGWADTQGRPPNVLNTAEALIALLDGREVEPGDARIQFGVKFIRDHQILNGRDRGAWPRDVPWAGHEFYEVPDLVRSSFAVQALIKSGVGVDQEPIVAAVDWMLSLRNQDHGWGCYRGASSNLLSTCFALMALSGAYGGGLVRCQSAIDEGLALLATKFRNLDGSFGNSEYPRAVQTINTILVLQLARRHNLRVYPKHELEAIDWLLQNPDEARRLEEVRIVIDPARDQANYNYLFMTDALLVGLLSDSTETKHSSSELADDALSSLKDKMGASGGFLGYRFFSWSTAKAITALSAAAEHHAGFPTRRPEYSGLKIGHVILGFAVLIVVVVAYLSAISRLDTSLTPLFAFLMLAVLLAYGLIGEKTFKELASPFARSGKGANKER